MSAPVVTEPRVWVETRCPNCRKCIGPEVPRNTPLQGTCPRCGKYSAWVATDAPPR